MTQLIKFNTKIVFLEPFCHHKFLHKFNISFPFISFTVISINVRALRFLNPPKRVVFISIILTLSRRLPAGSTRFSVNDIVEHILLYSS